MAAKARQATVAATKSIPPKCIFPLASRLQELPCPTEETRHFFHHQIRSARPLGGERALDFPSFCFGESIPNEPECANFALILRHLLLRAISTQPCYVSTLCVEIALIITFAIFAQIRRMRRRIR